MATWSAEDVTRYERAQALVMPIASMGFPVRITNTLEELGVLTLSDLLDWTQYDLLQGGNLGVKTLDEIQAALKRYGFQPLPKGTPPKKETTEELSGELVKRKTGKQDVSRCGLRPGDRIKTRKKGKRKKRGQ